MAGTKAVKDEAPLLGGGVVRSVMVGGDNGLELGDSVGGQGSSTGVVGVVDGGVGVVVGGVPGVVDGGVVVAVVETLMVNF